MRGMFTAGVLDVFLEQGIELDGVMGVSVGAVFGANYKSKQIGRAIRSTKKYSRDPSYGTMRSLIKTGDIYDADFCYFELPRILDPFDEATYRENPIPFYVVATDVTSGKAVYTLCNKGDDEDLLWMRASASLPVVSRPVRIHGKQYLDGGIADPIPYQAMERLGFKKNVVVLTQPPHYRKKKIKWDLPLKVALLRKKEVIEIIEDYHHLYNFELDGLSARKATKRVFIIQPKDPVGIGRLEKDPNELERVYQMGRKEALERLEELRTFLQD